MSELFGNMRYGNEAAISGLKDMLSHVGGSNLTVVEVGSYAGESAEIMLSTGRIDKIYCVDPWIPGYDESDATSSVANMAASESAFDARFSSDSRVVKLKMTVQEALSSGRLPAFVDLVYIDANHQYDSVVADIRATCRMCRVLAGHDFWLGGVKRAVAELYGRPSATFKDSSWLVENPANCCSLVIPLGAQMTSDERHALDRLMATVGKGVGVSLVCGHSLVGLQAGSDQGRAVSESNKDWTPGIGVGRALISEDHVRTIFSKYGLDKGGSAHDYCAVYAEQFSRLLGITGRNPRITVVGAFNGGNLLAFSEAVPDAEIYCIDESYRTDDPRFTVVNGNGYSRSAWDVIPYDMDLIVDDGSHLTVDMVRGIPYFREHLAVDGSIIIEDITTEENALWVSASLPDSSLVPVPKVSIYDDDHVVVYDETASRHTPDRPKILFVTGAQSPDYQNDALFLGLVSYGADVTDSRYLWFLSPVSEDQRRSLYGRGFTYSGKLPDRSGILRNEDEIRQRISDRYYDAVIYGSVWRCRDYLDIVRAAYPKDRIIFVDGEDSTNLYEPALGIGLYFKRELAQSASASLLPISFAIDERQFDKPFYEKTVDLAAQVPGLGYDFTDENAYYRAYRESRFAFTWKKGGFDCMRHYEIVAAGSVPLFPDIGYCPENTMWNWPKALQRDANTLAYRWLSGVKDETGYARILGLFTEYGRENLTTKIAARYVLGHL